MSKKQKITREELVNLAREMNEVMGLEPKIAVGKKVSDDDLLAAIKENAEIYATDFEEDADDPEKVIFTEEAAELFKKLGIEVIDSDTVEEDEGMLEADEGTDEEVEEEEPAPKKKGKKETPVKEEKKPAKGKKAVVEEESLDEEVEEPKPKKKAGKKVVEEEQEEEVVEEKPAKGKKKEKTEKQIARDKKNAEMKERVAAKKKEKADKAGHSMNRYEACAVAFSNVPKNKPVKIEKLYGMSDAEYGKCGGKAGNERENQLVVDRLIGFLMKLDLAKKENDTATFLF